jgi:hypothetical protein
MKYYRIMQHLFQVSSDFSPVQTVISWAKVSDEEDISTTSHTLLSQSPNYTRVISRAKIKTIKLTTVVIIFYIISSAPFIIGQIITVFGSEMAARKMGN